MSTNDMCISKNKYISFVNLYCLFGSEAIIANVVIVVV